MKHNFDEESEGGQKEYIQMYVSTISIFLFHKEKTQQNGEVTQKTAFMLCLE